MPCVVHPSPFDLATGLPQDGYMTLASLTSKLSLRLFKVRPKLHMMCHLQLLGVWVVLKHG